MSQSLQKTLVQIRAAREGDRAALDDLLARYLPFVRRAVEQQFGESLRSRDSLGDVVQESLLDAFKAIHRFEERDLPSFKRWLAQIVVNNVRDHARRRGRRRRGTTPSDMGVSQVEGNEARPSQHAQADELRARIDAAMRRLPPALQQIVELRARGRSDEEIAASLGYGSGASVRSLHHRALQRLKQLLGGDDAQPTDEA